MAPTGTFDLRDALADNRLAADVGYNNVMQMVSAELAAYNQLMNDSLSTLASQTTERLEGAPLGVSPRMVAVDEYGRARTQKGGEIGERGFPFYKRAFAAGFTTEFLEEATVGSILRATQLAELAHTNEVRGGLCVALLTPINRDFEEYIVTPEGSQRLMVPVKALYNGDDEDPSAPNGGKIAAGHNHYLYSNGLSLEAALELAGTVAEHSVGNSLEILINQGDAALYRNMSGFVAAQPGTIVVGANQTGTTLTLDTSRTDDRIIGVLPDGTTVRTKPWMPKNYSLAVNRNGARPVKMRVHPNPRKRGLTLEGENVTVPLQARYWRAYHGFGVSARGAAAVLYHAQGATRYVSPDFSHLFDEEGSDA